MRKPTKKSPKDIIWPRRVAFLIIIIAAVAVAVNVIALLCCSPSKIAQHEMESMARDYYENYYYASVSRESMAQFADTGFPPVSLRTLLVYDEAKNLDKESVFDKVGCDGKETRVIYYPQEPYGTTDYRMEIKYSCNF